MSVRAASSRPWWLWHLCIVATVVVISPFLPWLGVRVAIQAVCGITVIPATFVGMRMHRPPHRAPWRLLIATDVVALLGSVVWPLLQSGSLRGSSSAVDLLYYATYPLLALALIILPVQGRSGSRFAGLIEAGIITSGAAVLWWVLLVDPLLIDSGRHIDQYHIVTYPMFDMAVFALGIRLLLIGETVSMTYALLAGATACLLAADTANFVSALGGGRTPAVSAVGWLLANALLGAAALHPSMARSDPGTPDGEMPDSIGTARIYIVTVVATPILTGAFLLHELWHHELSKSDILVPVGATALTAALVVTRMRQLNLLARRRAAALEQSLLSEEALQQELRRRAQHDVLTGLPNRSLLYDRLTHALAVDRPGALAVLDLDEFKEINDRFGHTVGDEMLVEAARRLRTLRGSPLVARLDSDEFAILLEDTSVREAEARASSVLDVLRTPLEVQHHELFATASVGLRYFDPDLLTADVLRDAYVALHAAKAAGRDQMQVFDQSMREARLAKARTVERLRGAIEREELLVYYQPLVRLADERMTGVEALVRWQPPGERMIPPDKFIPEAEDSGLIVPIGTWVLREACRVVAGWHKQNGAVVSVNVSPRQLREQDFAGKVLDALRDSGLPPQALILEITEGVLVASGMVTEQAIGHLSLLRDRGVKVAVDDFGTGYSSLAYLRDLPIDNIKIDKSFMPEPGPEPGSSDPAATTMVKAIIDLAAGLRLSTIAEGVETAEQVMLLRELGCERAQGYFFARPVPEAEAAVLLAESAQGVRRTGTLPAPGPDARV
jgi:diguanylate cyclase (GGDEF)-like protein